MSKRNLILLVVALAATNVFFLRGVYVRRKSMSDAQASKPKEPQHIVNQKIKTALFTNLANEPDEIIFLGDSHIEYFPVTEVFKTTKVKNRGISGNTSRQVLERLNEVTESSPKKIFLEIGINDLFIPSQNPDSVVANITSIIDRIHTQSPKTELYVHSLFPVKEDLLDNTMIKECNKKLQAVCIERHIIFVNLFDLLTDGTELKDDYTYDGIHMNAAGYKLWENLIARHVN